VSVFVYKIPNQGAFVKFFQLLRTFLNLALFNMIVLGFRNCFKLLTKSKYRFLSNQQIQGHSDPNNESQAQEAIVSISFINQSR